MRKLSLSALLFLSLAGSTTTAQAAESPPLAQVTAQEEAARIYHDIVTGMYPAFNEKQCGEEMVRVLQLLTRLPKEASLNEEGLLAKLRKLDCIGRHFHVIEKWSFEEQGGAQCSQPALSLKWSGVWVLAVRDFYVDAKNFGSITACTNREKEFRLFLEEIWSYRTGAWPNDPLILDLRDNAGGSVKLLEFFVGALFSPSSQTIIYTDAHRRGRTVVRTAIKGFFRCPEAILVNAETASSGEVTAEIIRDWCPQTPVIGQVTYKKGVSSRILPLGNFSVWFPTSERLIGSSQRIISDTGVVPDIETEPGKELETALKYIEEHLTAAER